MKRGLETSKVAKGTTKTSVRADTASADGKKTNEVVGAKCKIDADELLAEVVTPQVVVLPKFIQRAEFNNRGLPSSLIVTCQADKVSGMASVSSQEKAVCTTVGGGLAAALITVAVTAAIEPSTPWAYPCGISGGLSVELK